MTPPSLSSLILPLILAGLCSLSSLSHAQANLSIVYAGDKPVFEAYLLEGEFPPEGLKESSIFNVVYKKTYYATPLHPGWKQGTFAALQYFADMIGPR